MGNEESQQGGAPGQQQGAPGGFGMGPPQQQTRFGVPQIGAPPGLRQVAPTGRPNLRAGGPGPPQPTMRGAFPGAAGTVPRQQQPQGGPVRPVQVGVQPWAEPPVQQPPHFRGPAPQPLRPQLQQQQQQQQQQLKAKQQQQMMEAEMDAGVDLSNLSEEEKARILSVMARAQDMDQDYERHKRAKEEPSEVRPPLLCPLCQAVDLAMETNKMCGDCGKNFCQKCGTFVPGEGRRSVWVCNTCSNRRKQISAAATTKQQDTTTFTMAGGQKVAGDPGGGSSRKDETMSRMGQPFQTPQQTQQQQQGVTMMVPTGSQQQPMVVQQQQPQQLQQQQPSVSLLGGGTGAGSSGGSGLMSGSLIPSSAVGGRGAGTIPGTVPLAAVPQQQPWNGAPTNQQTWTMQQTPMQQPFMQQGVQQQPMTMSQQQHQGMLTTQQKQLGKKGESCGSGWSPVTDLSPILDVSPSLGAAERELMEKCALQGQREGQLRPGGIPRAQSGTVSSLLADFNKSVGQTTPTIDDGMQQNRMPLAQQPQPQQQTQLGQRRTVLTGGTEMDQNQNLVQQHQFRLQQQQLMIQQQQQVIQQQQQQLQQQQMHQQQLQGHQQVMTQENIQQQQPMTGNTLVQQQAGVVVMGGTPMQQQTQSSQRKVHGRLPQPTVDQMQAAVALAAQTPRSKPQASTRTASIGVTSSFQRPVSPIMQSSNTSSLYESSFLGVPQSATTTLPSSLYTSAISPSQRKDQDCMSLTESESGKVRRRLPPVPLDQEPTTVPLRRTKDRSRTLSMPLSTSADRGAWMENSRRMPQRTTSLDDGMSLTKAMAGSSILDSLGITTSSSTSADTYLRLLGLIGTSTATTTTTTTTSILDSIPSSVGLSASLLGRRDLSAPHSLSLYRDTVIPTSTSGYLLDSDPGSKLPSYIMSLKQQLREELRSTVTDINRRRITDPDLSGLLSHSAWASDTSYDRKLGPSSTTLPLAGSRMAAGTAAARRNRHRRHASDTKLSSFRSFGRDEFLDDPLSRYKLYRGTSTMPFKSYEFESIDDHLGPSYGAPYRGIRTYPRGSSLTDLMPDELRDTAVGSSSLTSKDSAALRRYNRLRRHTDTGLASLSLAGLDPYGRHHHFRGGPRSWHPSPYVSEDEDTEREEKKAKIKAEIARRRQHIEERLMHHSGEQYPYKTRNTLSGYSTGGPLWADRLYDSPLGGGPGLEMDPMTTARRDTYTRSHGYMSSTYPAYRNGNSARYSERGWPYDPYAYADDLADPYDLDAYSPTLDSELAPMPLLPDMPTRSRRLLHDLGSAPLGPQPRHNRSGPQTQQQHYDDYGGRSRRSAEDPRHHRPPPSNGHPRHSSPSAPGRKAQNPSGGPKYEFPVKRILLTRDPKDRSVSGNGLGMKVVGGKEIPGSNGEIGAYVARIYPGGVVETLGEVREGDQVLEWNGVSLTGKTYEEVQRIIATSGDEVEIVIRSDFNMLPPRSLSHQHHNRHHQHEQQNHPESRLSRSGGQHNQSSTGRSGGSSYHNQQQQQTGYRTSRGYSSGRNYDGSPTNEGMHNYNNCADLERCGSTSPPRGYRATSPTRHQQRIGSPTGKADTTDNKEKYRAENITGEIQLQVCYDSKASILYVTIVRARNLVTSRDNSGLPDPYVKCYLLPDRRVENQRRTRYFSRCSDPEWKQTMVYPQVPQDQLRKRHLEISVWNYDVARPPEFLGEVILDLKDPSVIDEQSRWYKLHPHDPKKYPSQSNNEGGIKMARLNNPVGNKNALYLDNDDIRKQQHTA